MFFKPLKPTLIFPKGNYTVQRKYDGERVMIIDKGNTGSLMNRRGINKINNFPELRPVFKQLKGKNLVDAELVVMNNNKEDFGLENSRSHLKYGIPQAAKQHPAKLMAFDVLQHNNKNISILPWSERNKILNTLPRTNILNVVKSYPLNAAQKLMKLGEGVVFKKIDSPYTKVRNNDWFKFKKEQSADLVVTGYVPGKGKRAGNIGALNVGYYNKGQITNVGKVGSFSMSNSELKNLRQRLDSGKKTYVKVNYLERGTQGNLRMPKVVGIRDDISLKDTHVDNISRNLSKDRNLNKLQQQRLMATPNWYMDTKNLSPSQINQTKNMFASDPRIITYLQQNPNTYLTFLEQQEYNKLMDKKDPMKNISDAKISMSEDEPNKRAYAINMNMDLKKKDDASNLGRVFWHEAKHIEQFKPLSLAEAEQHIKSQTNQKWNESLAEQEAEQTSYAKSGELHIPNSEIIGELKVKQMKNEISPKQFIEKVDETVKQGFEIQNKSSEEGMTKLFGD